MRVLIILQILVTLNAVAASWYSLGFTPKRKAPSVLIVGGEPAVKNELPYQVSLRKHGKHMCGGAIVTSDTVLTAAHCVEIGTAPEFSVMAGDHDLDLDDGTEQLRNVSKITIHENYDPWTWYNDIAVLTLSSPLTLNGAVSNIPLPAMGFQPLNRSLVLISGWGITDWEEEIYNATLQKTEVPVLTDDECRVAYGQPDIIDSMLCAGFLGEGEHDACSGDDGGPLVCNFKDDDGNSERILCGIFSFNKDCGSPDLPGVYTEISYFSTWIQNNTRGHEIHL